MVGTLPNSAYVGRIINFPAGVAAEGLERCIEDSALRGDDGKDRAAISFPWGRLRFDGPPTRIERRAGHPSWPVLRATGTLRSQRGWYRVRVELEMFPHSHQRAELGLRPARRWPPLVLGTAPYFRYGVSAQDHLVSEIEQWAAVQLDVEGGLRRAS